MPDIYTKRCTINETNLKRNMLFHSVGSMIAVNSCDIFKCAFAYAPNLSKQRVVDFTYRISKGTAVVNSKACNRHISFVA